MTQCIVACFLFFSSCLVAEWNAQFDAQTDALIHEMPLFQDVRYTEYYAH